MAERTRVELYLGDCLEVMPTLAPGGVAMVFADLPYSTPTRKYTDCAWDVAFDLETLSQHLTRVLPCNGVCTFTSSAHLFGPLIEAIDVPFKYDLVWHKTRPTGHLHAKRMPLRAHESILVFYNKPPTYHPQLRPNTSGRSGSFKRAPNRGGVVKQKANGQVHLLGQPLQPISVFSVASPNSERGAHPTQKPVALLEWLVKTYTNSGDTVLDPVAGSFTTAVAAIRNGRSCVAIEKDPTYFAAGVERVKSEIAASGADVEVLVHS